MNCFNNISKQGVENSQKDYETYPPPVLGHFLNSLTPEASQSQPQTVQNQTQFNFTQPKHNGFSGYTAGSNMSLNGTHNGETIESSEDAEDEPPEDQPLGVFDHDINDTNQRMFELDSGFTLEEKIVSAVWVHEREQNKMSWPRIMKTFRMRFGKEPPPEDILQTWELKLFKHGNVHPRSKDRDRVSKPRGRPRANGIGKKS